MVFSFRVHLSGSSARKHFASKHRFSAVFVSGIGLSSSIAKRSVNKTPHAKESRSAMLEKRIIFFIKEPRIFEQEVLAFLELTDLLFFVSFLHIF